MGFQGNLYCCLLSDSTLSYSVFTPALFCWFNFLDMKAAKELYERGQEEKIGG